MDDLFPLQQRVDLGVFPTGPLLLSARDLASMLRLSLRTIRLMNASGRLPTPLRIGGSVRWRADEIRAWLDAGAPDRATWERMRLGSGREAPANSLAAEVRNLGCRKRRSS
ncbi:MAG: helix-turn-helix domain-containing protein [Thermogemmata sp.]|nr:helix-turn-helix domain-containing protein [Thermogemmata sp.]